MAPASDGTPADPPADVRAPRSEVAITVDDLPRFEDAPRVPPPAIHRALIAAFARHHIEGVYGFVNGAKLRDHPEDRDALVAWLAAGHRLGNHTYSHATITSDDAYLRDVDANEPILRELVGTADVKAATWKVFRYPSLTEGLNDRSRAAIRRGLLARGYRIAPVTIDSDDWAYAVASERCEQKSNQADAAQLSRAFVSHARESLVWADRTARRLFGRPVPHVLVLHVARFDALVIDDLLAAYEQAGVRFVTLDRALADEMYATEPRRAVMMGGDLLSQVQASRGVTGHPRPPASVRWLETLCR